MSRILCNKYLINNLFICYSRGRVLRTSDTIIGRNFSFDTQSYVYAFRKLNENIGNSWCVTTTKQNLISFHEWLPISWSLEIALITIAIRALVTFPLSISQQKILSKYECLQPEINRFANNLLKDIKTLQYLNNLSPLKAKLLHNKLIKQEMKRLIIRDNCHPMKASIVIWFQMPVWVILSHAIRGMAFMYPTVDENSIMVYKQMSNEGILWFTDLTQTDPYFVLPFLTAIINLTIVQIHSNQRLLKGKKTKMHTIFTNFGRVISVILIPIALQMPSSVCFYWFVSSSIGLIQNLILYNKRFKQIIGIDRQ